MILEVSQEINRELKQYLVRKLQTVLVSYFTSCKNNHSSIYRTFTICLGKMIYLHLCTHSPKDISKNIHSVHTVKQCKLKNKILQLSEMGMNLTNTNTKVYIFVFIKRKN